MHINIKKNTLQVNFRKKERIKQNKMSSYNESCFNVDEFNTEESKDELAYLTIGIYSFEKLNLLKFV